MSFLKKSNTPDELPDLAIDSLNVPSQNPGVQQSPIAAQNNFSQQSFPEQITSPPPASLPEKNIISGPLKKEVRGEDYLEFSEPRQEGNLDVKKEENPISEDFMKDNPEISQSFFDTVLEDINGEIKDLGNLEDWYKNKFLPQDVVSSMRGFWEGNKTDIIIQSFGKKYKDRINEKIKVLQGLEGDWREIYFRLIKKEEEMKKEERELKEILSEFVELNKRRSVNNEEGESKEEES